MPQESQEMKTKLNELLSRAGSVAIIGHIRPDGDDVGSCLALYNYIKKSFAPARLRVFMEEGPAKFGFLASFNEISHKLRTDDKAFDLVITSDVSTPERLGEFGVLLDDAKNSICIDHHKSNPGFCEFNEVRPESSSTCEVVYELIDETKIDKDIAECLYTGIINDTGVFKYSSTSKRTMEIAGTLMSFGLDCEDIIDKSFYSKSFNTIKAWGYAYENAVISEDGRCIYTIFTWKDMKRFHIGSIELDGISSELRNVDTVEFSMLIYQNGENEFKVSMRSKDFVDVSVIGALYNGGGHAHAAGCTCNGEPEKIAEEILAEVRKQL